MRNEAQANEALHTAALERQRITAVLSGSKAVQRQRYQRVAKKQHTRQACLGSVVWFCVTLSLSAFVGTMLAY